LTVAGYRAGPTGKEDFNFFVSANERGEGRVSRSEPADLSLADDLVYGNRRIKAFDISEA
jgi:hypothetical protein